VAPGPGDDGADRRRAFVGGNERRGANLLHPGRILVRPDGAVY
jgi:hypothetical protein